MARTLSKADSLSAASNGFGQITSHETRKYGGFKMFHSAYLSNKQKHVLEDLFSGSSTTEDVLDKWKVTRRTYHKWHSQEFFSSEFKRLLALRRLESELVLAHYYPEVAAKLVNLTCAEKEETARKACSDIIKLPRPKAESRIDDKCRLEEENLPELSPELASRLLAVIADERKRVRALKAAQDSPSAASAKEDGNLGNLPSDEISQKP
jgi:hypothetical protein